MKKRILSFAITFCALISLMPGFTLKASAAGDIYPEYVITHGASGTSGDPYYIYEKATDSSNFVAFGGDEDHGYGHSTIENVMLYITPAVGAGHATLIFGEAGTDENATGTLDIGSEILNLGASGTYTIKGSLSGNFDYVIGLSGASVEVSGGTVSAPNGIAIYNDHGAGNITVSGGTVSSSDNAAIYSHYGSGNITVSGGEVSASAGNAICNYGSGNIFVNSGKVTCSATANSAAISNFSTGSVTVSSGRVESTNTNAIYNEGGNITVSGGTVESTHNDAINNSGSGNITVSGDGLVTSGADGDSAVYIESVSTGNIVVSGGTLTSSNESTIFNCGSGNITVSGGLLQNSSSNFGVIYCDEDSSGSISISGGTLINSGSDGSGRVLFIDKDSTVGVSITDGTLACSSEHTIYSRGSGDITISGGTLENSGADYDVIYCGTNSSGNITISGGTLRNVGSNGSGNVIYVEEESDVSVTVTGGTLENTGKGKGIDSYGSHNINVSGGKIYSAENDAIYADTADIYISGDEWNEDAGTGTLIKSEATNAFRFSVSCANAVYMTGGTIVGSACSGGEAHISGGRIEATNRPALMLSSSTCYISGSAIITSANTAEPSANAFIESHQCPGTIFISDVSNDNAKLYVSGGTITNTAEGCPAIFNLGIRDFNPEYSDYTSEISLAGTPVISGSPNIWTNTAIAANDSGETPVYYSGNPVSVYFGGTIKNKTTVAVSGVSDSNYSKFNLTNEGYSLARSGSNLLISSGTSENSGTYIPSKTITVSETSSDLFSGSKGQIKAEANMTNAFSESVEVKVTDTKQDASGFGLGAGNGVYPFDISLYIKGTNTKTEPKQGYAVTISLPVPEKLLNVKEQLTIMHKSDKGTVSTLQSQLKQIDGTWYLVFEASEFSPYALAVKTTTAYDESAGLPYYVDSNGIEVFIGFAENGKCISPAGVKVLYKKNPKTFSDTGSHWAKASIGFVAERELVSGTGNNRFSPDAGMTRAMLATIIGRLYECSYTKIKTTGSHAFTDCSYNDYYGKYVDWAAENGIIAGYGNGKFGPNDPVTREQLAVILYRFTEALGALTENTGAALMYADSGTISSWAKNAAQYCQSTGIITGRVGGFIPQGAVTRAEASVMLEKFIGNIIKAE